MAVAQVEGLPAGEFFLDVFAQVGEVAVDDGAAIGDAALVVAADDKSEAAGGMLL